MQAKQTQKDRQAIQGRIGALHIDNWYCSVLSYAQALTHHKEQIVCNTF